MGVTIFSRAHPRSDGAQVPAREKKWWGPVVLEAAGVSRVNLSRLLREEERQPPWGLDAPMEAWVQTQRSPNRPVTDGAPSPIG
ncbi:MAG: hypothetical protein CMN60_25910 [Sphingobium sp.]|nr:hypothetical protein [Sphingobium sp.]